MRVVGPAPMGGDFLEIVLDEAPLRQAMLRFSFNIMLLSLVISGITAMLVYFALHYLLVRPMRRITANMMRFRDDPENPARVIAVSQPPGRDRPGRARARRHAARSRLDAAAEEPSRGARACGVEDQPRPAQSADLGAAVLRGAHEPARSAGAALRAEADARARARHRVLQVDAVLRPRAGAAARSQAGRRSRRWSRRCTRRWRWPNPQIAWIAAIERGLIVDADPDQLLRVLLNLARNAVQALETRAPNDPARDQVRITGRREGAVVVIEVSDTGPGIPAKVARASVRGVPDARRAAAARAWASSSPPSSSAPMAARSSSSRAPSGRPSGSPFRTGRSSSTPTATRGRGSNFQPW